MRQWRSPGTGSTAGRKPGSMKRIVIALDEDTFEEVRAGALKAGCSFGEQARMLICFGLETEAAA